MLILLNGGLSRDQLHEYRGTSYYCIQMKFLAEQVNFMMNTNIFLKETWWKQNAIKNVTAWPISTSDLFNSQNRVAKDPVMMQHQILLGSLCWIWLWEFQEATWKSNRKNLWLTGNRSHFDNYWVSKRPMLGSFLMWDVNKTINVFLMLTCV